jgi:hypothetical protein
LRLWIGAHKRKGWLFSDTVAGANASANLYSLVQNSGCSLNGLTLNLLATRSLALDRFTVVEHSWLCGC